MDEIVTVYVHGVDVPITKILPGHKGNPLTVGRPCRMRVTPGVPLEERVVLPGTPAIRKGDLIPSDAPGFGIEVTMDWLESKAV